MFRVKGPVEQVAGKTNKTKSQNETKPREWLEEIKTVRVGWRAFEQVGLALVSELAQWAVVNPNRPVMLYFIGTTYSISGSGTSFPSLAFQNDLQIHLEMTQNITLFLKKA